MVTAYRIALVGNPNCGKTTLFNALTGARQRVGNWPGVTVEKKTGHYLHDGQTVEVVDLPGTYSLEGARVSPDERVAHDFIAAGEADLVVNIVDAANLERNLYLTTQLASMNVPLVVALNMVDVAAARKAPVDAAALAAQLGCPVLPIVAARGEGIEALKDAVHEAAARKPRANLAAISTLSADADARADDIAAASARYAAATSLARAALKEAAPAAHPLTERIDRLAVSRWLGIPIFLGIMYLMFMFTIRLGGAFIDFFDQAAGALFVDGFAQLLDSLGAPEWLTVILAKGIGGGIQTVASFIPIIGCLYLFLSLLEDSGYMARAAFVMDRFMSGIGLPGKAFVPLVVGFGCNVPAIMATRTLERRRDRLMTIAMAPFMSCGARLPVYVLFAAAFFPTNAQNVVFALYLAGIALAVLTGLTLKNTLLAGRPTPFVMELPPYHVPTLKGVLIHGWTRLKGFIVGAGRIIVPMVLVLNFLNAIGTDGSFGNEDSDKSLLAEVGRGIAPAFAPMGLTQENWPATVGIFTGLLAKEAVVGTLNATYKALAEQDAPTAEGEATEEAGGFHLGAALAEAFATIPVNLADALGAWADPIGLAVGDLSDVEAVAEAQEVSIATFGAMAARFDGAAGAFAYLLFVLLYTPCAAALAAIHQESGARWMLFVGGWTFALAYGTATLWYQIAHFARDPLTATLWIGLVGASFSTAVVAMRRYAGRLEAPLAAMAPTTTKGCSGCSKAGECGR